MLAKQQTGRLIMILGLFGLISFLWIWPALAGQDPTAITLDYFEGYWFDDTVELEWGTGTELNTQGFQIHRAEGANQPANAGDGFEFIVVEVDGELYGPGHFSLIPAEGDGIAGGDYFAIDEDVVEGRTYWYIIAEQEGGSLNFYDDAADMVRVDTVDATPTPTPAGLGGGGGNTATPSPTMMPTNTPQPTATQQGGGSNPTATSQSTATTSSGSVVTVTPTSLVPTATLPPAATAISGGGGVQPTATLVNSSSPGGDDDGGQPVAQVTVTTAPGSYPQPGSTPAQENPDDEVYPEGEAPTATAYPVGELPEDTGGQTGGQPAGTDTTDFLGRADETRNGASTNSSEFLNGSLQQGETQSRERLLLWIGFVAALLVFAGGMFGSIVLFTRQRA